MVHEKLRLALLISGGGTTMQEIIRACHNGRLPRVEPACVIASTPHAGGIPKAQALGLTARNIVVIDPAAQSSVSQFGDALIRVCRRERVDIVGQYGWMPKTPASVIEAYQGMMINQHPGPLEPGRPDFGGQGMFGRRVHCARLYFLRQGQRLPADMWTEATAQRVSTELDKGAVLRTRKVLIRDEDDPYSLQERVLPEEHRVQIDTLRDFTDSKVEEMVRDLHLIGHMEHEFLVTAKRIAALLFPKG